MSLSEVTTQDTMSPSGLCDDVVGCTDSQEVNRCGSLTPSI